MLRINNLSVKVGEKEILRDISLSFEKGKVYAIMGPNGSGKSTLAKVIFGHPSYQVASGRIEFEGQDITGLAVEKRARLGLFLGFQTPLEFSGISVIELLQAAVGGKKRILEIRRLVKQTAKQLNIREELLERSLNKKVSGGEKKKLELLQAAVIDPKFSIFDEIDTGVDVDALRQMSKLLNAKFRKQDKSLVLITHYNRILDYVKPDEVIVIIDGRVIKVGGPELAKQVEVRGYKGL
ncbi:MAG: Fe-S cluster assembly ATPase SufC [bacterium]|nr:Fe-S cluster assembly ATPase SufC [bacterium]